MRLRGSHDIAGAKRPRCAFTCNESIELENRSELPGGADQRRALADRERGGQSHSACLACCFRGGSEEHDACSQQHAAADDRNLPGEELMIRGLAEAVAVAVAYVPKRDADADGDDAGGACDETERAA